VPIVLKSGSLNLLENTGPVQACKGIALPFFLPYGGYAKIRVFKTRVSVIPNSTLFIHIVIKASCATLTSVTSNTKNRTFFVQGIRFYLQKHQSRKIDVNDWGPYTKRQLLVLFGT
jgi:hypothetical protein